MNYISYLFRIVVLHSLTFNNTDIKMYLSLCRNINVWLNADSGTLFGTAGPLIETD